MGYWSCAGVTLAGTICQLSRSIFFPGFLYFEIWSHHHLRKSCSFQTSFLSTVVQPVWFSLWSVAVIPSVSACNWVDVQAGPDARMLPSLNWRRWLKCEGWRKAVRCWSAISSVVIFLLYSGNRPYFLILLLGHNDIECDTSADKIANHLIVLAQEDSVMSDDASLLCTPGCAMQDGGSDQEECQQTFTDILATGTGDQSSAKIVCLVY